MKNEDIKHVTERIEAAMWSLMSTKAAEKCSVTHYGANHIHPKHLVYWICVQSDAEKKRLTNDVELNRKLRSLLVDYDYPLAGREDVFIGFESQETVSRDSGGNWWHHWK